MNSTISFINGMSSDPDGSLSSNNSYRLAKNRILEEVGNTHASTNIRPEIEIQTALPENHTYLEGFSVVATYGDGKATDQSILLFSRGLSAKVSAGAIHLFNERTRKLYTIFNDDDAPSGVNLNERAVKLNIGQEIDMFYYNDSNDYYAVWVDGVNPIRRIKLHVNDPDIEGYDVTNSVTFIPNEADLLYHQRLYPGSILNVDQVIQNGGGLKCGSYQFAFRYYNTETNVYSTFGLLSNSLPIIPVDTLGAYTNDIHGGGVGQASNKSIKLSIDTHHHHKYYDSIQLCVVKHINGSGPPDIVLLPPSKDFYLNTQMTYTGNEAEVIIDQSQITVDDSPIESALSIEESNGRIYIFGVNYSDLEIEKDTSARGSTVRKVFSTHIDPMAEGQADNNAYYDEHNCYSSKGYFGDEVYRFGKTYVNKFGVWARPKRFKFTEKYDINAHSATWQRNWSSSDDWKFPDRKSRETHLVSSGLGVTAFGLSLQDIGNHPEWAYGMAIVRRKRKKNILGQTPIINGVAYQGGAFNQIAHSDSFTSESDSFYDGMFYTGQAPGYDYSGEEDYFGPKILSHGHAFNLTHAYVSFAAWAAYRFRHLHLCHERLGSHHYSDWEPAKSHGGISPSISLRRGTNGVLFTYPLEYLANVGGEAYEDSISLESGAEKIDIIDARYLEGFNSFRTAKFKPGVFGTYGGFSTGSYGRYAWVFSAKNPGAYYYYTPGRRNIMLYPITEPSAGDPVINMAPPIPVTIMGGKKVAYGSPGLSTDLSLSTDERMAHIRKICNANNLFKAQFDNEITDLYDEYRMIQYGDIVNQRSLVLFIDPDPGASNEVKIIMDPTYFVWKKYIDGSPVVPFSTLFPGNTAIDNDAVGDSDIVSSGSLTAGQLATDFDTVKAAITENSIIDPGTGIVVYMANIVRGLGDDRYGDDDAAQEYIFTGAQSMITKAHIDGETIDMTVFGGDCYVTRNIFNVRTNAVRKHYADINDSVGGTDYRHPKSTGTGIDNLVDYVNRAVSFDDYIETVDVWVESTINGHYIYRNKGQYPSNVTSRDSGHTDIGGTPEYSFPSQGIDAYAQPRLYLYNPAYSVENELRKWYSRSENEPNNTSFPAAIHISTQRVINTNTQWDRFLSGDTYQMDPTPGKIIKAIKMANRRILVIQENAPSIIYLGQILAEDQGGATINISSASNAIGTVRSLIENSDVSGEVGAKFTNGITKAMERVFVVDHIRKDVSVVSEGRPASISEDRIEEWMSENIYPLMNATSIKTAYDQENRRLWIMANDETGVNAITYIVDKNIWESTFRINGITVKGLIGTPNGLYVLANSLGPKLYKLHEGEDRSKLFGSDNDSEIVVTLSDYPNHVKLLDNVIVAGSSKPDSVEIEIWDEGAANLVEKTEPVSFHEKRAGQYHANEFRLSSMSRVRGKHLRIRIKENSAEKSVYSSITLKYRLPNKRING